MEASTGKWAAVSQAAESIACQCVCALFFWCVCLAWSSRADAAELKSRGELRSETRFFVRDDNEPLTEEINSSIAARLELSTRYQKLRFKARGFARYDPTDVERSAVFAEDAYAEFRWGRFRIRAGALLLNWTATEAFHPADIINSRYLDSNLENAEKLGEPMVATRFKFEGGNVEFFFMPFFLSPILPSPFSRLSFGPPGVALDSVLALERGGEFLSDRELTPQFGARVQKTIGDADVSMHVVSHIDRTTPLLFVQSDGVPALVYQPVVQYGGTYQHILGALIAKVEASYRRFYRPSGGRTDRGVLPDRPNYSQLAVGFEYGMPHASGGESTLLFEGQSVLGVEGEGFLGLPDVAGLELPLFQRDVLTGYRYAANDVAGRELLLTVIVDAEDPKQILVNGTYSQRMGETFGLKTGFRFIRIPSDGEGPPLGFAALDKDHQVFIELSKYF